MEELKLDNSDDQILYRIIDFFEVLALASSGNFRVSRADQFSDCNELVGCILSMLDNPDFVPYTEAALSNYISQYKNIRESYFISSWTMTRDSIAMWELYSPDKISVQIGVRKSVVRRAFNNFYNLNNFALGHQKCANDPHVLFYPPAEGGCEYVNFNEIMDQIEDRYNDFYGKSDQKSSVNEDFNYFLDSYRKFISEKIVDVDKVSLLKDRAYSHEREYRFCLRAVVRNDRDYEDCKKDPLFALTDSHLRLAGKDDVGTNIYLPFEVADIAEVWVDGRLPPWKAEQQIKLLEQVGLSAKRSPAYGEFLKNRQIRLLR